MLLLLAIFSLTIDASRHGYRYYFRKVSLLFFFLVAAVANSIVCCVLAVLKLLATIYLLLIDYKKNEFIEQGFFLVNF